MHSISFCLINFENFPSKTIYRVQSIKFNISTAIVGGINHNGIVTFGKICRLPSAGTALICIVIKRLQVLGRGGLNIPISKPSFRRHWYSRGLTEKKLQTMKFVGQYRISHSESPSTELFVLDIYYVFISIVQKFALLLYLTRCIIHHISIPCRSRAHRDGGLKANHSFAFSITFGASTFD